MCQGDIDIRVGLHGITPQDFLNMQGDNRIGFGLGSGDDDEFGV